MGLPHAEESDHLKHFADFLEKASLYKAVPFPETASSPFGPKAFTGISSLSSAQYRSPPPKEFTFRTDLRIDLVCPTCGGSARTFSWITPSGTKEQRLERIDLAINECHTISFACTRCQTQRASILIHVSLSADGPDAFIVMSKYGQWPSVRPQPDPNVARALGAACELYTQGLTCERTSFGIGAFAYYRRVTEDVVDRLMADLKRYAHDSNLPELQSAIEETASETRASERIRAVKDLLPPILTPEGVNPLATIYAALSEGLHSDTDAECLERAQDLRESLDFLLKALQDHIASTKQYLEATRRLQAATAKKNKKRSRR